MKNIEKSFIREISGSDELVPRTMTGLVTGFFAGEVLGPVLSWVWPVVDAAEKKGINGPNVRDYIVYKTGTVIVNYEKILIFAEEKYNLLEPHFSQLINNF